MIRRWMPSKRQRLGPVSQHHHMSLSVQHVIAGFSLSTSTCLSIIHVTISDSLDTSPHGTSRPGLYIFPSARIHIFQTISFLSFFPASFRCATVKAFEISKFFWILEIIGRWLWRIWRNREVESQDLILRNWRSFWWWAMVGGRRFMITGCGRRMLMIRRVGGHRRSSSRLSRWRRWGSGRRTMPVCTAKCYGSGRRICISVRILGRVWARKTRSPAPSTTCLRRWTSCFSPGRSCHLRLSAERLRSRLNIESSTLVLFWF